LDADGQSVSGTPQIRGRKSAVLHPQRDFLFRIFLEEKTSHNFYVV
jgi:hypothetical protein